jgi:hypothetical protein
MAEELHVETSETEMVIVADVASLETETVPVPDVVKTVEKTAILTETEAIAVEAAKPPISDEISLKMDASAGESVGDDHTEMSRTDENVSQEESVKGNVETASAVTKKSKATWTSQEVSFFFLK